LEAFHTTTVKFFVDRKPHSRRNLQNVKSPIHLVHCGADIAYEIGYVEELRDALDGAGLDVRISQVAGAPHFGCVTHPEQYVCPAFLCSYVLLRRKKNLFYRVNELFHDWVLENVQTSVPPAKLSIKSPFEAGLNKAGYVPEGDSDSDDTSFVW
jgi:hypothetical protein